MILCDGRKLHLVGLIGWEEDERGVYVSHKMCARYPFLIQNVQLFHCFILEFLWKVERWEAKFLKGATMWPCGRANLFRYCTRFGFFAHKNLFFLIPFWDLFVFFFMFWSICLCNTFGQKFRALKKIYFKKVRWEGGRDVEYVKLRMAI